MPAVVPRSKLPDAFPADTLLPLPLGRLDEDVRFRREAAAEDTDELVELVAYTCVWQANEHLTNVLVGQRLGGAGEGRLHGEKFVGWGGHIEPRDFLGAWFNAYEHAAIRELQEELVLSTSNIQPAYRGAIYTDEDDVSSDHVALVFDARVDDAEVREGDKYAADWTQLQFTPTASPPLVGHSLWNAFETWTQILLPALPEWFDG